MASALTDKWGGACTAAAFLGQFVDGRKWAHLDIAGVNIFEKDTEFTAQGASGFGVRLLTTYFTNLTKKIGSVLSRGPEHTGPTLKHFTCLLQAGDLGLCPRPRGFLRHGRKL